MADFPCMHAVANTPMESVGASFARFPTSRSLPPIDSRVGFHIALFETCSAFTRVTACILAKSPRGDSPYRRLQPLRYLHDCSDYYRLERKLPGGALATE